MPSQTYQANKIQAKPNQTKPSQAKPNQTKPSQAKPSQAKPRQPKPSQAKPSQAQTKPPAKPQDKATVGKPPPLKNYTLLYIRCLNPIFATLVLQMLCFLNFRICQRKLEAASASQSLPDPPRPIRDPQISSTIVIFNANIETHLNNPFPFLY